MRNDDYYVILGISRSADPESIRDAFRRLAYEHHPDRAGRDHTSRFQKISEAYTALSDPDKRRRYDRWLNQREDRLEDMVVTPVPSEPERVEPLFSKPVSMMEDFHTHSPSLEQIYQRFLRNFTGLGAPKGDGVEPLAVELVLTRDEAARGGELPIGVPVFRQCPLCDGTGDDWGFPCMLCNEQGVTGEEAVVKLRIPPGVRDNSIYEIPIRGLGIHNFHLQVVIRIGS